MTIFRFFKNAPKHRPARRNRNAWRDAAQPGSSAMPAHCVGDHVNGKAVTSSS
jgi:hypothetical protein